MVFALRPKFMAIVVNILIILSFRDYLMENSIISTRKLETYQTKNVVDKHVNGSLTVVWRNWDDEWKIDPKMVYVTSANPWELKGPHLHTKRDSYFVCIRGKVIFVVKDHAGKYNEIESSEENPVLIHIPKNIPSAHMNISDQTATVLAIANLAWRPNDNEMTNISFDDYDWGKWKKR